MIRRRPVLITDAELSQEAQLRARQIRYASMMGIRVLCLILAGVLVSLQAPLLWLWLPLCVIGMVLLPWMAVLIANDRLPKQRYRIAGLLTGRPWKRSLDTGPQADDQPTGNQAIAAKEHRVIDPEG